MKWIMELLAQVGSENPAIRGAARFMLAIVLFVLIAFLYRGQQQLSEQIEARTAARFNTFDFVSAEALRSELNTPDVLATQGLQPVPLDKLSERKQETIKQFLYSVRGSAQTVEEKKAVDQFMEMLGGEL